LSEWSYNNYSTTSSCAAATVQLLHVGSGHLWAVVGMFFGLWLIPMGRLVVRFLRLLRALGWIPVAGRVGYLVSGPSARSGSWDT
jgi:hypothetical protein